MHFPLTLAFENAGKIQRSPALWMNQMCKQTWKWSRNESETDADSSVFFVFRPGECYWALLCLNFFLFGKKKKDSLVWKAELQTEREWQRKISQLLVSSPNGYNDGGRARTFFQVFHVGTGVQAHRQGASLEVGHLGQKQMPKCNPTQDNRWKLFLL